MFLIYGYALAPLGLAAAAVWGWMNVPAVGGLLTAVLIIWVAAILGVVRSGRNALADEPAD